MWAVCHEDGCPAQGTSVDVGEATRVVCGGCQSVVETYAEQPPKVTARRRAPRG